MKNNLFQPMHGSSDETAGEVRSKGLEFKYHLDPMRMCFFQSEPHLTKYLLASKSGGFVIRVVINEANTFNLPLKMALSSTMGLER